MTTADQLQVILPQLPPPALLQVIGKLQALVGHRPDPPGGTVFTTTPDGCGRPARSGGL